ncbi:sperm-associated antigen 11B isoform X3 [Canis lupus baileyi]|uniref:sperm-associated antigen 11B isoform X3 n=1 Tax=Canis lupus dingo TaxID=286419 RepID=UPI000DC74621|nr:sperm-associated antigen 11B isoform X3 [Canis lupus dingo]
MKSPLSPLVSFLLVALMFPGPSRARNINHQGTEGPREPWEESPGQGKNESHLLHHREKRRLLPRTPPYLGDMPPGIRDVICLTQHGTCRLFFCHFGERKAEICSDPWNRCCLPSTEAEIKNKPETNDRNNKAKT